MTKLFTLILTIVLIAGCNSSKKDNQSDKKLEREKRAEKDSIIKSNLLIKYKGIEDIGFFNNETKYSIDYQSTPLERKYLLTSPELIDIFKSDSVVYVKYFQSSYPNDFIFILSLDTNKVKLDRIKEEYHHFTYIVAKAKYLKLVDLKFISNGEITNTEDETLAKDASIETEIDIEKGQTIILKGAIEELIDN